MQMYKIDNIQNSILNKIGRNKRFLTIYGRTLLMCVLTLLIINRSIQSFIDILILLGGLSVLVVFVLFLHKVYTK